MENQNSLLLKLSRLLPSSFSYSCNSRTLPDVAHTSTLVTKSKKTSNFQRAPKPEDTRSPDEARGQNCPPVSPKPEDTRSADEAGGQNCPPVSPVSTTPNPNNNRSPPSNGGPWFTSSVETDTFHSVSSNSGDSGPAASRCSFSGSDHASTKTYYGGRRRRRSGRKSRGVIEEGSAVERRSRDPYGDFMASMVEMIIEKRMFGAKDLDRLLSCFLDLNEVEYHGIIFQVFSEICQTLFCN